VSAMAIVMLADTAPWRLRRRAWFHLAVLPSRRLTGTSKVIGAILMPLYLDFAATAFVSGAALGGFLVCLLLVWPELERVVGFRGNSGWDIGGLPASVPIVPPNVPASFASWAPTF